MFKVGDKIRCIDCGLDSELKLNNIYTVKRLSTSLFSDHTMVTTEETPGKYYTSRFILESKAKVMPLERLPKWW